MFKIVSMFADLVRENTKSRALYELKSRVMYDIHGVEVVPWNEIKRILDSNYQRLQELEKEIRIITG